MFSFHFSNCQQHLCINTLFWSILYLKYFILLMFSLNNHSLFHRHNNVLFYKSAICLSGFILRCTIHLEVLFILIGAGVNTWVIHKCSIYNVLFIFFIAVTKHLTKYHEGGKTDCDFRGS